MAFFLNEMGRMRRRIGSTDLFDVPPEVAAELQASLSLSQLVSACALLADLRQATYDLKNNYNDTVAMIAFKEQVKVLQAENILSEYLDPNTPGLIDDMLYKLENLSSILASRMPRYSNLTDAGLTQEEADVVLFALAGVTPGGVFTESHALPSMRGFGSMGAGITLSAGTLFIIVGLAVFAGVALSLGGAYLLSNYRKSVVKDLATISCASLDTDDAADKWWADNKTRVEGLVSAGKISESEGAAWLDDIKPYYDRIKKNGETIRDAVSHAQREMGPIERLEMLANKAICCAGVLGAVLGTAVAGFLAYKTGKFIYRNL